MKERLLFVVAALAIVIGLLAGSTPVAATEYSVSSTPYTNDGVNGALELWDTYTLTAANGKRVTYSVSVNDTADCVSLLFVKGHGFSLSSQYFVAYSQENCVDSYTKEFPVASADGTQFTVVIMSTQLTDVEYTLEITIKDAPAMDLVLGIVIVLVVLLVPTLIVIAIRRRKRAKAAPPMAPGQPPMTPPGAPPAQPPSPPPP